CLFCYFVNTEFFNIKHCKPLEILVSHPFIQVRSRPITSWPYQSIVLSFKTTKLHYSSYMCTMIILESGQALRGTISMCVNMDHSNILVLFRERSNVCKGY